MSHSSLILVTSVLTLTGFGFAQSGDGQDAAVRTPVITSPVTTAQEAAPEKLQPSAPGDPKLWRIPIHTGDADPEGGKYGIWAAGPTYKASFHDGFVFYPVLGGAYPHNLPLRWTTKDVRIGQTSLLRDGATANAHSSEWRYEFRYPGMTEAYDILEAGVEQTFVFHRKPAGTGDLVVIGAITTELVGKPVKAAHAAITFADDKGKTILKYGAAFAYDSTGRRTKVTTSFDGEHIRLTLAGTWLAHATYPVTIDPLTSRVKISIWGGAANGTPSFPDVCRDDDSNRLLTSYSRRSSASDYDTFARRTTDTFGTSQLIFTDVTASWSTRYNQCCHNSGPNRWSIVLGREFSTTSGVRVYVHVHTSTVLNSGVTRFLSRPTGFQDQTPSIGGVGGFNVTGNNVYLAWRRDRGTRQPNTSTSKVYGCTMNVVTGAFGTQRRLSTLANSDEEWPCVTKISFNRDWVACWQEYNNAITRDDWDARIARITNTGVVAARSFVGPGSGRTHKVRPKVSGALGRYMCTFTQFTNTSKSSSPWGRIISDQRFNWTGAAPTKLAVVNLRTVTTNSLTTGDGNRGIAYDSNTDSHWAVAYHSIQWDCFILRTGASGCSVESRTLYNTSARGFSPSLVYNDDRGWFSAVWATTESPTSNQPVYGANFTYFTTALCTTYGTGCQGTASCFNRGTSRPYAGSQYFGIRLTGGLPNRACGLFIGPASSNIPIGGGCFLNVNPFLGPFFIGLTNAAGSRSIAAPLPDCPTPFIGTVYCQWFQIHPGTGLLRSSRGVRIVVR